MAAIPLYTVVLTIAAGQSISAPVDCGLGELVRLYTPAAWTPANLTFALSPDNVLYGDLFDAVGQEQIVAIRANAGMVIGLQWRAVAWVKFRSGTRDAPIVQTAARQFKLVLNPPT